MKPSDQIFQEDEIDLGEIIRKFWKEKFLILTFSLIFSVLAYVYIAFQPKIFETTIILRNISSTVLGNSTALGLFNDYHFKYQTKEKNNLESMVKVEFHQNLNSFDNLDQFVEQNNSINSFKALLKEQKISAKNYFFNVTSKNKFGQKKEKNKIIENMYYLNFPKELKGDKFLDEYVLFTFQKTSEKIIKQLITFLNDEKELLQKNLIIAKRLNLKEPILQQKVTDRSLFMINEPKELYYKGATVLQLELEDLKKLLIEVRDIKLDFEPILDRATKPIVVSDSPLKYAILGFIAGLFLSLIFILFRNVLKNSQ